MFYVIPSWYGEHTQMPFDDAIQHVKLFRAAGETSQLLVLSYLPQLRYFLHQKELLELPVWSLFDMLQGVSNLSSRLVSFRDLSWPTGTAFSFTPFLIMADYQGHLLAHIHLGEDGQLLSVDYFEGGELSQVLVLDDRGFISSVAYYTSGQLTHRDYLNPYGIWQFREQVTAGQAVLVPNPKATYPFKQETYSSLAELQEEVVATYLEGRLQAQDVVFLASDQRHNAYLLPLLSPSKILLSFFEGRGKAFQVLNPDMERQLAKADLIIADRQRLVAALQAVTTCPVVQVSPFDTRLRLGHSQQFKEQYLYVVLDGLDDTQQSALLTALFDLMAIDDSLHLLLVSYVTDPRRQAQRRHQIVEQLAARAVPYLFLADETEPRLFELMEEPVTSRVSLHQTMNEQELIALLDKARVVIDLADEPDLYTQIAAISAGLPQVNATPTEFVVHGQNGYLLSDLSDLVDMHAYYLVGLRQWNEALVYATQKLAAYTSGQLVHYLKEQLGLTNDESSTD